MSPKPKNKSPSEKRKDRDLQWDVLMKTEDGAGLGVTYLKISEHQGPLGTTGTWERGRGQSPSEPPAGVLSAETLILYFWPLEPQENTERTVVLAPLSAYGHFLRQPQEKNTLPLIGVVATSTSMRILSERNISFPRFLYLYHMSETQARFSR